MVAVNRILTNCSMNGYADAGLLKRHANCLGRYVSARLSSAPRQQHQARAAATAYETPSQEQYGQQQRKIFADFAVYKGKGAMKAVVISPSWRATPSGDVAVDRPGTLFLEFADAQPGTGNAPGNRRYNWEQKQTFALSAVELGNIVDPDPKGMKPLMHDPNMMGSNQGAVVKSLSIQQLEDKENWYIALSVKNGQESRRVGVNISRNEFCVLQNLAKYAIPHILGFDAAFGAGSLLPVHDNSSAPF